MPGKCHPIPRSRCSLTPPPLPPAPLPPLLHLAPSHPLPIRTPQLATLSPLPPSAALRRCPLCYTSQPCPACSPACCATSRPASLRCRFSARRSAPCHSAPGTAHASGTAGRGAGRGRWGVVPAGEMAGAPSPHPEGEAAAAPRRQLQRPQGHTPYFPLAREPAARERENTSVWRYVCSI